MHASQAMHDGKTDWHASVVIHQWECKSDMVNTIFLVIQILLIYMYIDNTHLICSTLVFLFYFHILKKSLNFAITLCFLLSYSWSQFLLIQMLATLVLIIYDILRFQ